MKELIERLTALDIVEQRLDRHASAYKHWSPAHRFWIAVDCVANIHDRESKELPG